MTSERRRRDSRDSEAGSWPPLPVRLVLRYPMQVGLGLVLGLVAALFWLGDQETRYEATTTLLVNSEGGGSPLDVKSLIGGGRDGIVGELTVLGSRQVARATVRSPADGELRGVDPTTGLPVELGQTTLVHDRSHHPLAMLWHRIRGEERPHGRLLARLDPLDGETTPEFVIHFLESERIAISAPGSPQWESGIVRAFEPGVPFVHAGVRFVLDVEGEVAGKSFRVQTLPEKRAVDRLRENTNVRERQRGSGVVELTVRDSDPWRAAETANAVAVNYIEVATRRALDRASRTVAYINAQLEERMKLLNEAEREVARLQSERPERMDLEGATRHLVSQLRELEKERMQMRVLEEAFAETVALVESGETNALSHLPPQFLDPVTRSLLQEMVELSTASWRPDRADPTGRRRALATRIEGLEVRADEIGLRADALVDFIENARAGDRSAFARLGALGDPGDPLTRVLLDSLARLRVEEGQLESEVTDAHPLLADTRESIRELEGRIIRLQESRLAGLRSSMRDYLALGGTQRELLEAQPEKDAALFQSAREKLRTLTVKHLAGRLRATRDRKGTLDGEIEAVEARLSRLPEEIRTLASAMREREAHQGIVAYLSKALQEAEISRTSTERRAELIDVAVPPTRSRSPRPAAAIGAGLIVGFLLGVGAAALRHRRETRVVEADDFGDAAALPVLGEVPLARRGPALSSAGTRALLEIQEEPEGPLVAAWHDVLGNLELENEGQHRIHVLGMTTVRTEEDRSGPVLGLATILARTGQKVAVVETDGETEGIHAVLGMNRRPGLGELLAGRKKWRQVLKRSPIQDVHVLPVGTFEGTDARKPPRERLCEVLEQVREQFDLVLLDLPPATSHRSFRAFADACDALLLVGRARTLTRLEAHRAGRALVRARVATRGVVLDGCLEAREGALAASLRRRVEAEAARTESVS